MATPNMGITEPILHVTVDSEWSQDLLTAIDVIDAHDHTPGKGVPIPTDAIDMDADLSFESFAATNLKQVTFTNQNDTPASTLSLYWKDRELWLNNSAGVPLQLTDGSGAYLLITQANSTTWTVAPVVADGVTYSIDHADGYVFFEVNVTANSPTINLPYAAAAGAGRFYIFKDIGGASPLHPIQIRPSGANTIDGETRYDMDQKNGWSILTSDGATNWYVLKPGFILNSTTPADNDTLMYDSATNQWGPVAYPIPDADATTKGIVKLTNDFGGTAALPLVAKIQGVTSPAAAPIGDGYVMCSSSATQLVYSKITDGYVATNAAIAGTKINPNFGNQTATLMGLALTDYYLVNDTDIESDLNSMINIDSTDGYFYVQLPNPTTHPTQVIFIRDVGGMLSTNQVTIKRHGSELLNKLAYDKVLSANWGTWMFWNDGTDWYV